MLLKAASNLEDWGTPPHPISLRKGLIYRRSVKGRKRKTVNGADGTCLLLEVLNCFSFLLFFLWCVKVQMLLQFINGKRLSRALVWYHRGANRTRELCCCGLEHATSPWHLYPVKVYPLCIQSWGHKQCFGVSRWCLCGTGGSNLFAFGCLVYMSSSAALHQRLNFDVLAAQSLNQ